MVNVLIVEDQRMMRETMEYYIRQSENYRLAASVANASYAEACCAGSPIDLILMDIQMPKMNGYRATKAIRTIYPDKHIPIIALSANAFAEDKTKSLAVGMDDHVAKPINFKELFNALARLSSK